MRAGVRRWTGGAGRRGMRRACGRLEAGVAGIVMRAPLEFSDSIQGSRMTAPLHVVILAARSEEHTSELQSLMRISYAVFCLTKNTYIYVNITTRIIHNSRRMNSS